MKLMSASAAVSSADLAPAVVSLIKLLYDVDLGGRAGADISAARARVGGWTWLDSDLLLSSAMCNDDNSRMSDTEHVANITF